MTKSFSKFRPRILFLTSIIILIWTGLIMRFFYIQIVQGSDLREMELRQGQNKVMLPAVRGTIYDRNYQPLAENVIHFSFGIHPSLVENRQIIIDSLIKITGQSPEQYLLKFSSSRPFEYLVRNLKNSVSAPLLSLKDKGLVINRHGYRIYPHGQVMSQIIGFTDVDNNGLAGIELELDKYLRGRDGWIILQSDGKGRLSRNSGNPRQDPIDGSHVILTIDLDYQSILRDEILRRIEETGAIGGMGIILDPFTGKILAMTSIPDFDSNNRQLYSIKTYRNRVLMDAFEPGSTFKIVPAIAALANHSVSLQEEFNCGYGQYNFRGHVINDWEEFGLLTFPQIIEKSSNVGIIKIAETVGSNKLYQYIKKFGFGSPYGIQFAEEATGIVRPLSEWSAISLAEISLGHEISVTTLQLALAYAAIANGGFLMKPLLVDEIVHSTGKTIFKSSPQIIRQVASKRVMEDMTNMLRRVVKSGTGTHARLKGWDVAGKTGTAQKYIDGNYSKSKFFSSFAGFFPAENPQLVGVIILDEPKVGTHWGGIGAAPVFKRVMTRIIQTDDRILVHKPGRDHHEIADNSIFPSDEVAKKDVLDEKIPTLMTSAYNRNPSVNKVTVPNVKGMSMRNAVMVLRNAGLKPKIKGSGAVVIQHPRPGTVVESNTFCLLVLQ